MPLALFDLDHTLLDGDSNTLWLDFLVERGHLPASLRQQQADYLMLYAAQKLDIVDYLSFHLLLLKQRPLVDWLPVLADYVSEQIVPRVSAQAREAVAAHRARGHHLAIITATHSFLSSGIGELFDMPVIAPRGEVRDGYLTGRVEGSLCFREQKLSGLSDWLADQNLSREAIGDRFFYSDSANDLPLLEAVSHPVAVNADERLTSLAEQRNWPRLIWRCH